MTRTLFFFTCLVAMIATLTAVVIRFELANPGVSVLFQTDSGAPDGAKFGTVAMTHALFSYLAVMLLGTTMIAAAREKGVPATGLLMWIGVVFCIAMVLIMMSAEIPLRWFMDDLPDGVVPATGWTLYPPLAAPNQQTLLSLLTSYLAPEPTFFEPDLSAYTDLSRYFAVPAAALLYIGAFTLVSCERDFGWIGVIGTLVTLIVAALSVPLIPFSQVAFLMSGWLAPAFLLLACVSIRVLDGGPMWALVLAIGTGVTILAQIALMVHPSTPMAEGTIADIMALYAFPFGLVWFALPALMLFRDGTRLGDAPLWAMTLAITLGLILWIAPLIAAGHMGQPFRYVDYPNTFAVPNMIASIATVGFVALILSTIVYLRRARA